MQWVWIPLAIVVLVLVVWLHPDERAERAYKQLIAGRKPIDDDELLKYFEPEEVAPDIPGSIRAMFARHMDYPAEKMLPDDDLRFYWNEIDAIDIVREIEAHFGIVITDQDTEQVRCCSIRSVSKLVQSKRELGD